MISPKDVKAIAGRLIRALSMRENIASYAHYTWAEWVKHMFDTCTINPDGTVTIPLDKVERWKRQSETPYGELTEDEKDSDREQADMILEVIHEYENAECKDVC